jgi:1,2-dihydroxy-3-keto-5-methylthiopentene dioxygenase
MSTETPSGETANKKQKMDEYPMAPDNEWPEAWIMPDNENTPDFDQCKPNKCEPNIPVSAAEMKKIGIAYWKMENVDKYEYPVKAVPYDPKDAMDPKLSALRDSRGYSYADIITVHPDHLPEFETKIKAFFEEVSPHLLSSALQ